MDNHHGGWFPVVKDMETHLVNQIGLRERIQYCFLRRLSHMIVLLFPLLNQFRENPLSRQLKWSNHNWSPLQKRLLVFIINTLLQIPLTVLIVPASLPMFLIILGLQFQDHLWILLIMEKKFQ